jgi:putative ribosome biogenesis GTPase RsgA
MLDAVEKWRNNIKGDQVFIMLGQAGVGKSVFSAEVASRGSGEIAGHRRQDSSGKYVAAYHFFKHNDKRLSSAKNCIWMLSKQLRDNVPGFRKSFDASTMSAEHLSQWTVEECFTRLIVEPARRTQGT